MRLLSSCAKVRTHLGSPSLTNRVGLCHDSRGIRTFQKRQTGLFIGCAGFEAWLSVRLRSLALGDGAAGRRIDSQVVEGPASRHILRLAEERRADLIVLGSRHHSAIDRVVFGSHLHAVLRHATCPVLMVREVNGGRRGKERP